jgi:hypothetical protein
LGARAARRATGSARAPSITAVFTHTTDGNPPRINLHVLPSSLDPNTWPLRVPK